MFSSFRQRDITRQQVLCKRQEAEHRAALACEAAMRAETAEEYAKAVADGVRAAGEVEAWSRVLPSLSR